MAASIVHESGARERVSITSDSSMPDDLRCAAVLRLYVLLKIFLVLHALAIGLNWLGPRSFGWSADCAVLGMIEHGLGFVMTGAFLWVIKRGKTDAGKLLDWALLYQVVTCFVAAYAEQAQAMGGISIVAILILMFPLFVPRDAKKTLIAGMLSAAVAPLAVLSFYWMSARPAQLPGETLVTLAANFVFAGLAVVPSKVMAHLAGQVRSARRMGAYELTSKLGGGGMGEVWRARHRLLRRPAAIKLIRQDALSKGDSALILTRFEREAQ